MEWIYRCLIRAVACCCLFLKGTPCTSHSLIDRRKMTSNFHAPSSHCSASHVASNEGDRRASSAQCRSSSAYGSNPRYFDATFDRHPRARQARDSLNSYAEPIVVPPLNSKVSRVRFQSPAGRSAHHFLDRLGTFESLDHFGDLAGFILQCSAPGVEDDDEYIDISALADQYLDLSEHCPVETDLPSRYSSPSTDSHTSTDVECPQIRSNRRRSADVSQGHMGV
ncbi:hypothetical protein B0H10DRAFT_487118 [Mycena sp. CBHHK59/15]|nr:hypothetical protein B0H10DRAFT_487118 [Mycena sp. CBHHK59/15]